MGSGNTKHRNLNYQSHSPEYENKSKRKLFYLSPSRKDKGEMPPSIKEAPGIKGKSKRIKWSSCS